MEKITKIASGADIPILTFEIGKVAEEMNAQNYELVCVAPQSDENQTYSFSVGILTFIKKQEKVQQSIRCFAAADMTILSSGINKIACEMNDQNYQLTFIATQSNDNKCTTLSTAILIFTKVQQKVEQCISKLDVANMGVLLGAIEESTQKMSADNYQLTSVATQSDDKKYSGRSVAILVFTKV